MSRSLSARIRRVALAGATCAACATVFALPARVDAQPNELAPKHISLTVHGAADANQADQAAKTGGSRPRTTSNGISYHGGPVITTGTNAYVIWYGTWPATLTNGTATTTLVPAFFSGVNNSPYFNINTTYYNGSNVHVQNKVTLVKSITDANYSHGHALSDAAVQDIVVQAITNQSLPSDPNGVYFVLTSSDVSETSGFLTQYCGWHTYTTLNGSSIQYSFVGDASQNLSACAAQTTSSPNNNPAGDAMVSVIAHELEEATTDPNLNAWYDTRGYENADKCAWTFGTTQTASNGSAYNMTLGSTQFLIQRNWVNASGGYCSLSYP